MTLPTKEPTAAPDHTVKLWSLIVAKSRGKTSNELILVLKPPFASKVSLLSVTRTFADPEVKGIFTSIGGDDSVRILPYLDTKVIRENPKIFMGYSDTTTMNTYFNQLGLVTLNSPSIMAGFSQWNNLGT